MDINQEVLLENVRRLLGQDVQVAEWASTPIGWNPTNAVTGGLWRVDGTASTGETSIPWSLVLKTVRPSGGGEDATHYNYWKREILAYRSGVLDDLPDAVRAPRCLMIEEQPDGTVRLWLERIEDDPPDPWVLEHYERAAFALGRFNGAYLSGKRLPGNEWLCRCWIRSWVYECMKYVGKECIEPYTWRNPYLRSVAPAATKERFETLLNRHEHLIIGLESLPRVFCHNDAWQPNLFFSQVHHDQVVAIDWAFCGLAGVGEELGRFLGLTLHSNQMRQTDSVTLREILFQNYIDGLHRAGWQGDFQIVRFGFTASAALRAVMVIPRLVNLVVKRNIQVDDCQEYKIRHFADTAGILLDMADEAYNLLNSIPVTK